MDAWQVLGWIMNAIAAIVLGVVGYAVWVFGLKDVVLKWLKTGWRHSTTKHIKPEVGQVWCQDGAELEILAVEHGRVRVLNRWSSITWWDSPTQWEQRMRQRKLWLISRGD